MTATAAASTAAPEFKPIPTMIAERARERGSARAVVCEGRALSWTDFHEQVERVAAALAGLGLGKGDKVAILAPPSIDYVVSFLGILAAGACVVPLSTMAASEQLDMMLADSDSKALLLAASHKDLVLPREQALRLLVPGGRIAFDFDAPGWTRFADWLAAAPAHVPVPSIAPEDDFNLIYSSGTTGLPKGIMHSHRMRFGHVARGSNLGYGPDTVTLLSTPLYSNTTLVTLMPTLGWGGTAIVMPKFDVQRYLEIAERERVTHTMLVPVQYERILAHPDFDRFDLSSFRNKFSTSAPLRAPVKHDILKRWPGGMVEFYGLTEGGGTCILDAAAFPDKLHTVGKPAEGHDIRILDEQGKELPQGAVGEVVGRSPNMMTGYYKQPEKTREIYWHDADGNLFYKTGDLGRFDEDGFLVLLDRKKDMIISGGFNIYAADLEAVLSRHPDVLDVAVIGVPSRQWGETPLALVVRRPGSDVAADTLKEWANTQLGKGQRISAVEFRDHLPRSSIGKILKRELRQPYWAEAAPAR